MPLRVGRPRITIFRLMLLVAVAGVLLVVPWAKVYDSRQFEIRQRWGRTHSRYAIEFERFAKLGEAGKLFYTRQPRSSQTPFVQPEYAGMVFNSVMYPFSGFDKDHYKFAYFVDQFYHVDDRAADTVSYRDDAIAICRERAAYHRQMARKWSRGAWFPWHDIEPDPLMPPVMLRDRGTDQF